jgi:alkylation response protein AidB-like acyl-CoA dehydrogenase
MAEQRGVDAALWAGVGELGLPGLAIPEEYGGAGLGFVELGIALEEAGRALLPAPLLATALAAEAILRGGDETDRRRLLPGIASGAVIATVALTGDDGQWLPDHLPLRARRATASPNGRPESAGWHLDGIATYVLDGQDADLIVAAAGTTAGPMLFAVTADAAGLTRTPLTTLDQTRRLARLTFAGVPASALAGVPASALAGVPASALAGVPASALGGVPASALGGVPASALGGDTGATLRHLRDLAAVALAAEQVGGAARCLEMAVGYAKTRVQFGRPIGSFQAIKHRCADVLVAVESARSAAAHAARLAAEDSPDLPLYAALAKSYCSEAYLTAAGENIQIHGGIGFTWEHDAHLYFKRAKCSEVLFGAPAQHRARLAGLLELVVPPAPPC